MSSHDDRKTRADFERTFSTDHGQAVLKYLGENFGMNGTTFNGDPFISAFNEGGRNVILHIHGMLKPIEDLAPVVADPHDMIREEP